MIYIVHRVAILLACAAVFYPGFNPGRITTAINRNVSLFTASISYSTLVGGQLERPLARGWVQSSTFVLVMAASIILVVGIALCAVGGCMSVGNNRMQRRGLLFPLAGSLVMTGGLGGIYAAYSQIVAAAYSRVPANFAPGFVLYALLAAVTLTTTPVLLAMDRRRAETLEPKVVYLPL